MEGRGGPAVPGSTRTQLGGKKEQSQEREEQEETREGNSAAWRHAVEQDAWASP